MGGTVEMDASAAARILFFEVAKAEEDHLTPAEFELPDSIAGIFKVVASYYLEASMLLALQNAARNNEELTETLGEFEKLIVFGLDEADRAKYTAHITEAIEELRLLFSDEHSDWRESGFARRWLARVGVVRFLTPAQPGPFSSLRLTSYWMNMPLIMHRTIQHLVGLGSVEE
jgi:hypothetical protein